MTRIQLLEVPYDSGHRDARHGAGPSALLRGGAAERLARSEATVDVVPVDLDDGFTTEVGGGVEVMRRVARAVAGAEGAEGAEGTATVVLAGNCGATVGVMAAHAGAGRRVGVLWLDAHGDLQTPETTSSGFFDGTGLALLTGRCWRGLAATIPGFAPLPDEAAVLVGGHDLDPVEEELLASSALTWLSPARLRSGEGALHDVVAGLADHVDALHVHVDLDVLDTSVGRANGYATAGGLGVDELRAVLRAAGDHQPVVSATLASWDPALDVDGRVLEVALGLLEDVGTMLAAPLAATRPA
ncbi:arginase family protein [Actinotalea ferrariae]|uniref:arginase family protein n=1 Tax=Actinotalea ferrariae TaxID=1386098 RepID=UPI001C8BC50D|nr:arginase family protein [Actinotalea ferrariae]MBX9244834.1 arginase family protein [Actinotalea ferrariae]